MQTRVKILPGVQEVPGPVSETVPACVLLPFTIEFTTDTDDGLSVSGELELVDGRYRVCSLEVATKRLPGSGGDPSAVDEITSEVLRTIPVGRLVIEALRQVAPTLLVRDGDGLEVKGAASTSTTDERVFLLYHLARATGANTNATIAEELGMSRSGAAQRVAKLRRDGWLPPARVRGAHS